MDGKGYTFKSQTAYGLLSRDGQQFFSITVIDTHPYDATHLSITFAYLPTGITPPLDEWIEVGSGTPWDGILDLSTPTQSESAASGVVMYTELSSRFAGLFDSLPLDGGGFLEGDFAVNHLATESPP